MGVFTGLFLSFLITFITSTAFWLVIATVFNLKSFVRTFILSVILTFLLFGFQLIFDIGIGLTHIFNVAVLAGINTVFNVFTVLAMFALFGLAVAIISSIVVLVVRIFED